MTKKELFEIELNRKSDVGSNILIILNFIYDNYKDFFSRYSLKILNRFAELSIILYNSRAYCTEDKNINIVLQNIGYNLDNHNFDKLLDLYDPYYNKNRITSQVDHLLFVFMVCLSHPKKYSLIKDYINNSDLNYDQFVKDIKVIINKFDTSILSLINLCNENNCTLRELIDNELNTRLYIND